MELENNLFLWLATVNQYKIRDTFCSYSVMELCTKGLGNQVEVLKVRSSSSRWAVPKGFEEMSQDITELEQGLIDMFACLFQVTQFKKGVLQTLASLSLPPS